MSAVLAEVRAGFALVLGVVRDHPLGRGQTEQAGARHRRGGRVHGHPRGRPDGGDVGPAAVGVLAHAIPLIDAGQGEIDRQAVTAGHPQGHGGELRVRVVAHHGVRLGRRHPVDEDELFSNLLGQVLDRTALGRIVFVFVFVLDGTFGRVAPADQLGLLPEMSRQAPDLGIGDGGTRIGPTARGALTRQEPHGHRLDQRHVVRVAEAVQEEDSQGQGVGLILGDAGLADGRGDGLHGLVVGGDAALQQGQTNEGRRAGLLRPVVGAGRRRAAQERHAALHRLVDGVPIDRPRGRPRRGQHHNRRQQRPPHGNAPRRRPPPNPLYWRIPDPARNARGSYPLRSSLRGQLAGGRTGQARTPFGGKWLKPFPQGRTFTRGRHGRRPANVSLENGCEARNSHGYEMDALAAGGGLDAYRERPARRRTARQPGRRRRQPGYEGAAAAQPRRRPDGRALAQGRRRRACHRPAPRRDLLPSGNARLHGRGLRHGEGADRLRGGARRRGRRQRRPKAGTDLGAVPRRHLEGESSARGSPPTNSSSTASSKSWPAIPTTTRRRRTSTVRPPTPSAGNGPPAGPTPRAASSTPCTRPCGATSTIVITGKDKDGNVTYEGGWQNNRRMGMHDSIRFVENIFEELDAPGEWFLDAKARLLYFYPPDGSRSGQGRGRGRAPARPRRIQGDGGEAGSLRHA